MRARFEVDVSEANAERERREVVVIGGGLAGLAAAWRLRDRDVVVLERDFRVGGRLLSEKRGDVWLNFGAHVFGSADSASGRLMAEVGVAARSVPGRLAAVELGGRISGHGPVEAMPFVLPLSIASRAALVRSGARLRLAVRRYAAVARVRSGESDAARQLRMLEFMDGLSMAEFLGPLPADVDGLFRATLTRSSGEPEDLQAGYGVGYFHLVWDRTGGLSRNILGGSDELPRALAAANEGRIRTSATATRVIRSPDAVDVHYESASGPRVIRADAVVVATPAHVTGSLIDDLPPATAAALAEIRYGPYVVGAFLTRERRPMPWDRLYALATPQRSFSMLFNTANVLRESGAPRAFGGSLMVYAAADLARTIWDWHDSEIARSFREDLFAIYPDARRVLDEIVVHRWQQGLPYPRPGRALLQEALTSPLGRVHLAGDYLGTWYTETAVQTGLAAAESALEQVLTRRPC